MPPVGDVLQGDMYLEYNVVMPIKVSDATKRGECRSDEWP